MQFKSMINDGWIYENIKEELKYQSFVKKMLKNYEKTSKKKKPPS